MAPAHKIAASVFHQPECVIMHPIRLGRAKAGPFARWFLSPPMQFQMMAVDIKTSLRIPTHITDSKWHFAIVNDLSTFIHFGLEAVVFPLNPTLSFGERESGSYPVRLILLGERAGVNGTVPFASQCYYLANCLVKIW